MCGGGLAPPTQEVDCVVVVGVWWNVIVCRGLPVGLLGAVVGVFLPLPASGEYAVDVTE